MTQQLLELFAIESLWTEEQRLVRDAVRHFARERYAPLVRQAWDDERFPDELVPELAALGVLGAQLEGHGCAGLDATSYGLIMRELEYADSGLRSFASVQGALVMYPIHAFGSEEQKERYLPRMARGELVGCFGLTEPDSGSDPGSMRTRAKQVDGGWLLDGAKMWITNAPVAGVALVWAKTGAGAESIRGFLVERGAKGFSTPRMHGKHSLRASWTGEIVLENCFVPEANVLPKVAGLKGPLSCLTQARFGIAWGVLGAGLACYDTALAYARERRQFGKPIGAFQLTQEKLVEMASGLVHGHLLVQHLSRLKDAGTLQPVQVSLAKRDNARTAMAIARSARTILGANGIMGEFPVMRHAQNLESVLTYEGTHEVHTLALGRALTGLDAFV